MDIVFIFWTSFICLLLSWIIYPTCIIILARLKNDFRYYIHSSKPKISFIISAYNEESRIKNRIENLLKLTGDYPCEIIIGSDGSTDNTSQVARSVNCSKLKVLEFDKNRGRATVHNACVDAAQGNILIFTDAETVFEKDFLKKILPLFENLIVGAVSGRVVYLNKNKTNIGHSASLYWKYEELIRVSESRLNILAFGSGAALAIRKEAYKDIMPSEDIDYAATFEIVSNGYKVLYEPNALAYDYISETTAGAFKTRVRQTSRCFKSVLRRIFDTRIILKRPFVFLAALMHKTFRHLTPFFLILLFLSNLFLLGYKFIYDFLFILQLAFYILAAVGYLLDNIHSKPIHAIFSLPYSFTLLNISRGVGVIMAIIGKEKTTYQTDL